MGLSNDDERDPEAQELLPLYTENDPAIPASVLEPPDHNATPAQVRNYILSLLERRGVESDQAKTIAAKWLIGTGAELREYKRDMFVGIFGAEDGWVVHKDVQANLAPEVARIAAEVAEKQRQANRAASYAERWTSAITFLAGLVMLGGGIAMFMTDLGWLSMIGGITIFLGTPVTLAGAICLIVFALRYWGNYSI